MGRRTGTPKKATSTKRIGRQVRLDELLTPPRRSARTRRNSTLEKHETSKLEVKKQIGTTIIDVEPSKSQVINLVETSDSKKPLKSQVVKANGKEAVVPKSSAKIEVDEKELLKLFDLNPAFGPCRGISRQERYQRAIKYNLKPAPDGLILKILDEHRDDFTFQDCVWDQLLEFHIK